MPAVEQRRLARTFAVDPVLSTVAAAALAVLSILFSSCPADAQSTFPVRVTLNLCPEYPRGGVTLEVKYTIGVAAQQYDATVTSTSIDSLHNTATVDLALPNYLTTLPINIKSYCRSARGLSDASNTLTVSNCDRLALLDSDADGIPNNQEDTNCDNFFSPGDASNPDNVDTDGDGVRDLVEKVSATSATNPGDSPRPFIYESGPFDPDNDGNSNPVVWRKATGAWYIRDFFTVNNNLAFSFGQSGDIPFIYRALNGLSDVGVVRQSGLNYNWLFRGTGFTKADNTSVTALTFGIFGDNIVMGPWEQAGVTNPAVARLFNGVWTFDIYKRDGTIREVIFGGNGDVPKCSDYDGDGKFDIAVYRPSEGKTFIIRSSDSAVVTYQFGTGTADHTVRGDYTGDGVDDISYWEPAAGLFSTLTSTHGFNATQGNAHNPSYYSELSLGTYFIDLPLSWNRRNGKMIYTVVGHQTGIRKFKEGNLSSAPTVETQWGLPGDSQG